MSEFSDLLSLLIKSRDVNVSALTGYCELDRSTMYKLINGKRAPSSREQVQKIAEFINLNPLETKELMTAYLITKTGSEVYYRRQNVVKFILDFQEIQRISSFHSIDVSQFRLSLAADDQNTYPLTSQLQTSSVIHKILRQATARPDGIIRVIAQPEHLESLNIAAALPHSATSLRFHHILCITNSRSLIRSQNDYNLQCLKRIIPFYGTNYDYQPYYYYDDVNSHFNNMNFMPCVFLTETAAVVCTSDLKSGILFTRRDLVDLLQKRFEDLKKIATPLTISFSSVLDVHLKNLPMFLTETSHIYGLSAEPCLLPLLTGDMLERYVVKDLPNRQSLILMLKKYLDSVSSSNLHNYFSKEGILSFMETGKLHECPKDLYTPLSMPDRIYLLKKYREQLLSGKKFRLFGEVLDKFPSNLHLYTSMGYGYMVFSDCGGHLLYLVLKEQNLLTAFYDFSHSLKECSMICSQEETADFLQNIILQYSRRMTSATKITRQAGTSF